MAKPVIAVDFSGTLITEEPSELAHYEWFEIMAKILNDKSILAYAKEKEYFPHVYKIMERFTGLNAKKEEDKILMKKFARNLFQLSYFAAANKIKDRLLFQNYANYLKELKHKYKIILVTTSPEDIVSPILHMIKCDDIFDGIIKSPLTEEPNKEKLLRQLLDEPDRVILYLGNSLEDAHACKKLKIPFILAVWDKADNSEVKKIADFTAGSVEELKDIIKENF